MKLTYDEVKTYIEKDSNSGCKLLSKTYIDNSTPLKIKCRCGNLFETSYNKFKTQNKRQCNECGYQNTANRNRKTTKQFESELFDLVQNEYSLLSKYTGAHDYVKIKHNECNHIYNVTPDSFLQGNRCPQCTSSKGEKIISEYLQDNNIKYITEYKFNDCKNRRPLPFDFYLPDFNLLIEYDGEQHYRKIDFFGGEEGFKYRKRNDNIKNTYCIKNNIDLIRIPYWDFDNIEEILDEVLLNKDSAYFIA